MDLAADSVLAIGSNLMIGLALLVIAVVISLSFLSKTSGEGLGPSADAIAQVLESIFWRRRSKDPPNTAVQPEQSAAPERYEPSSTPLGSPLVARAAPENPVEASDTVNRIGG